MKSLVAALATLTVIAGLATPVRAAARPGVAIHAGIGLSYPTAVALDRQGNIYVADTGNRRLVKLSPAGGVQLTIELASFQSGPEAIALDPEGDIYTLDTTSQRVVELSPAGRQLTVFQLWLNAPSPPATGLAIGPDGTVLIASPGEGEIDEYSPNGGYLDSWSDPDSNSTFTPRLLAAGASGDVYAAGTLDTSACDPDCNGRDLYQEVVERYSPDGVMLARLYVPATGLAVGGRGNILVAASDSISKYSGADGHLINRWDFWGQRPGRFENPHGLAVNARGNVFVADSGNDRIQKLSPSGWVLAVYR
jgi:DNA-binding beta-propeller fold protein YncE